MKRSTYVHSSNKYNAQTSLAIYCHWWLTILTLIGSKVSIISFTRTSLQNYYSSIVGQQWRPLLPFCWCTLMILFIFPLIYFWTGLDLFLNLLQCQSIPLYIASPAKSLSNTGFPIIKSSKPCCHTLTQYTNPTIFNIIQWFAGSMGRSSHIPRIWCSKYFLFHNFLQNSLKKSFHFFQFFL